MDNTSQKIRLALVEDVQMVRSGIVKILAELPGCEFVFDAVNGQDFLDQLATKPIDVVLLDIEMPVLNGIKTLEILKKQESKVKVIMLTMHKDLDIAFEVLSKGADAYLLKESSNREMLEAITTVYADGKYSNHFMNEAIINSVATERKVKTRMKHLDLDERDLKIIRMICDGVKGQDIANAVFTSKKNLDLLRTIIMKKFKVKSANELIRLSIINGFYTPRSNEEIELEKKNILAAKKLRQQGDLLDSLGL
ncbi:MAG: response regulator transcription factor [Crocinitomicaceae bacterium]|jgi:two-component system, NarL family, response regulator DegU|nr:response regulator transcription factor [Crocinitomicaceae bacterium]MBP6032791.1 response regulator transcription factor [Crocinitomicaceae bacterium]